MEYNKNKKYNGIFIGMLFSLMTIMIFIATFSLYLSHTSNLALYKMFLNIILIVTTLSSIIVFLNTIMIIRLLKGKKILSFTRRWIRFSLGIIYSQIIYLSQMIRLDKNKIRRVFSEINNLLILDTPIHIKPQDILILLPHCLQKSKCPYKITTDINNCRSCGVCDIAELIQLRDRYDVELRVVTGGTLARKIIKQLNPQAIIAVACERDLSSGILDVKGIPVIGILNQRPEGPCINTTVDIHKIEESIKHFVGEENLLCTSIHPIMDLDQE